MNEFTEPTTEAEMLYLYLENACEVTKDALRAVVKQKGSDHSWSRRLGVAVVALDNMRGEAFEETKL